MDFILRLIAMPLGFVMWGAYELVKNYGLSIILFTIVTKILLFPLAIKQQKSSAKLAVLTPEMKAIQKKHAKDRVKMNEEMMRLYEEHDYNQMAGCLPLLLQMPIIFGLYEVIRNPLTHVLRLPSDVIQKGVEVAQGFQKLDQYNYQTGLKVAVDTNPTAFEGVFSSAQIAQIQGFDFNFFGLDLTQTPTFALNIMLLIPIISVGTMIFSQYFTMKLSGNMEATGKAMMLPMLGLSVVMTGYFAFVFPSGVSLYWIAGNVFSIIQSFALHKVYNPKKLREAHEEKLKERKKTKKTSQTKKIVVEKDNKKVEKTLSEKEYYKLRMQKARELDALKYGEEVTENLEEKKKKQSSQQEETEKIPKLSQPLENENSTEQIQPKNSEEN